MKGRLLLFLIFTILIGCKEEDMSPIEDEFDKSLLYKYIWINDSLIDEDFTDYSTPEDYTRVTTLSFTATQYTHTVQDSVSNSFVLKGNKDHVKAADSISEYGGDYSFNGQDSTLVFSYRVNDKLFNRLTLSSDSMIIYNR